MALVRTRAQARDSARRLATRQEQFSVLAHEIKTPLASITATMEIMLGEAPGPLNGDQRAFLAEIDQSTARMLLLSDNILTESKLQAGVFSPSFAPTDLGPVVREVWRSMRRLAEARGQQIALDYPSVMDPVLIDAALLRQAITNLLQNAIRHTSIGGVVNLRVFQNEREVVISVWDDGSGMDPEERKRAFKQFVSHTGGTGLGLTIVETIASLHGGMVRVDTSLGKGAAFLLTLPRPGR
ncbi:MAG: HAMP domain-containing sensor histidine kinase [Actinomycetota bacterium]